MASKESEAKGKGKGKGKEPFTSRVKSQLVGLGNLLYNSDDKTVLNRGLASWGKITAFYIIYYILLSAFWVGLLYAFFVTIDDKEPKHQDYQSLIKFNPGMSFRPQPDKEYTLIRFSQGEKDTYSVYTDNLDEFLAKYNDQNQTDAGLIPCDANDPNQDYRDPKIACQYPLSKLGDECVKEHHYGYDVGRPCVLLKMNKLFNWTPDPLSNDSIPEDLKDRYREASIGVTCQGKSVIDDDNIGPVTFYPSDGFDAAYFPYKNQQGYLAPVVMVQFNRLRVGTLTMVTCKVWAENIYHDNNDRAGSVHFEMLMD